MKYILTLILMFGTVFSLSCGGNDGNNSAIGASTVPIPKGSVSLSAKTVQTTPKGARVESLNGLSAQQLQQIDEGLTQAFNDGKASGWADNGKAYNYSMYLIHIPSDPCVPSPEQKIPSFYVQAINYDGSVYDQYNSKGLLPADQQTDFNKYVKDGIGVITAAEMLLELSTPGSQVNGGQSTYSGFIVCPDEATLKTGTEYGAEHAIVAWYDNEYFNLTQTHSTIGHPILPKRTRQARSLKSNSKPAVLSNPLIVPAK